MKCFVTFRKFGILCAILGAVGLGGCGYTTQSMLPSDVKTICIKPVQNAVNLSGETSDKERFRVYRPGTEVELTNAMINRFIFDGNLKVVAEEKADTLVEAKLTDYRRDPLRYTNAQDVQEYRLSVSMDVAVVRAKTREVLWHETVTGDTSFYLSGGRAISEDEAAAKAIDDTARRVVERTIEWWK